MSDDKKNGGSGKSHKHTRNHEGRCTKRDPYKRITNKPTIPDQDPSISGAEEADEGKDINRRNFFKKLSVGGLELSIGGLLVSYSTILAVYTIFEEERKNREDSSDTVSSEFEDIKAILKDEDSARMIFGDKFPDQSATSDAGNFIKSKDAIISAVSIRGGDEKNRLVMRSLSGNLEFKSSQNDLRALFALDMTGTRDSESIPKTDEIIVYYKEDKTFPGSRYSFDCEGGKAQDFGNISFLSKNIFLDFSKVGDIEKFIKDSGIFKRIASHQPDSPDSNAKTWKLKESQVLNIVVSKEQYDSLSNAEKLRELLAPFRGRQGEYILDININCAEGRISKQFRKGKGGAIGEFKGDITDNINSNRRSLVEGLNRAGNGRESGWEIG